MGRKMGKENQPKMRSDLNDCTEASRNKKYFKYKLDLKPENSEVCKFLWCL